MSKYSDAKIKEIFQKYDKDNSGFLDLNELKQAVKGLGVAKSDADIEKMLKTADTNGDGKLSLAEFTDVVKKL